MLFDDGFGLRLQVPPKQLVRFDAFFFDFASHDHFLEASVADFLRQLVAFANLKQKDFFENKLSIEKLQQTSTPAQKRSFLARMEPLS